VDVHTIKNLPGKFARPDLQIDRLYDYFVAAGQVIAKALRRTRAAVQTAFAQAIGATQLTLWWNRFSSADEMHEAVYTCLIARGQALLQVATGFSMASLGP